MGNKATALTAEALRARVPAPVAGSARAVRRSAPNTPLQLRLPAAEVRAIKRSAIDADLTISDYVRRCVAAWEDGRRAAVVGKGRGER